MLWYRSNRPGGNVLDRDVGYVGGPLTETVEPPGIFELVPAPEKR